MNFRKRFVVKPGRRVRLKEYDPADTTGCKKSEVEESLRRGLERLRERQYLLYAENRRALLIVLQAMDAGGKDGTIRHVMSGMNPQSCYVKAFKAPSAEELAHDFLWRIHKAVPPKGVVGIFNRSHYEDVLIVRVHNLVPRAVWEPRYDQINAFEETLAENGVHILKFFLHISKEEQKKRFQERLADPSKNWKFSPQDVEERKLWEEYGAAYEEALSRCSTKHAPWFIIPADRKWFRNYVVAQILVETLEGLDMRLPKPAFDPAKIVLD